MKKILLTFYFLALLHTLPGADQLPEQNKVCLHYSGRIGSCLQDLPGSHRNRPSLQKNSLREMKKKLQNGSCSLAISESLPENLPEGYEVYMLAASGIILAVNPENPLRDLSSRQVKNLLEFTGGSWKLFGGPARRIHLYYKSSPDLPGFKAKVPVRRNAEEEKRIISPRTIEEYRAFRAMRKKKRSMQTPENTDKILKLPTGSDEKTFSLLYTDCWGIGIFSLSRFDENRLRLLTVDHIPPTLDNFLAGSYPLMTVFYLISKRSLTPEEEQLRRYLTGRTFAAKLFRAGFLVYPPAKK